MSDNVHIYDSADKTPPLPPGRHPHSVISGESFPTPPRWRLPAQAWLMLTAGLLLLLVWAGWRLDEGLRDLFWRNPWMGDALLIGGLLCAVGLVFVGVLAVTGRLAVWVFAARIIRSRFGVPVDLMQVIGTDPTAAELPHLTYETARAPYTEHPLLSTKSGSAAKAAEPAAALPAPDPGPELVPDQEWTGWLNDAPHLMIAGSTGAGKTTFARIALRQALEGGASGLVIDPKGKDWYGLPVVGAGRDFPAMLGALDGIRLELDRRYKQYGAGERSFDPIVVIVDEVPDLVDACRNHKGTITDMRWSLFARSLGSLAREVHIRIILLTQSPNVTEIGISSGLRANYVRVALAEKIPLLINEDVDPARRVQLRQLFAGQEYPAAIWRKGEVHLLDTSRIPQLSAGQPFQAKGWQPEAAPVLSGRAAEVEAIRARMLAVEDRRERVKMAVQLIRQNWKHDDIQRACVLSDKTVQQIRQLLRNRNERPQAAA